MRYPESQFETNGTIVSTEEEKKKEEKKGGTPVDQEKSIDEKGSNSCSKVPQDLDVW